MIGEKGVVCDPIRIKIRIRIGWNKRILIDKRR